MKYTVSVVIDASRDKTVKILRSVEDAYVWMDGLTKFELIEGELETKGSKYVMEFTNKKGKKQEMIETIVKFNPPQQITTVYEMGGVWNECINTFTEEDGKTTYEMENTFKFPAILGLFMWMFKPVFKKQTLSSMNALKKHIESKK